MPALLRTAGLAAAVLVLAACASAPIPAPLPAARAAVAVPPVPAAGDISENTMRDVTRILSSDAFEGREPGTPGEEKTLALLEERFAAAGLRTFAPEMK